MGLPDRYRTEDLTENGFRIIQGRRAKHKSYASYRNQCVHCKDWYKQTINEHCKRCLGKCMEPTYCFFRTGNKSPRIG